MSTYRREFRAKCGLHQWWKHTHSTLLHPDHHHHHHHHMSLQLCSSTYWTEEQRTLFNAMITVSDTEVLNHWSSCFEVLICFPYAEHRLCYPNRQTRDKYMTAFSANRGCRFYYDGSQPNIWDTKNNIPLSQLFWHINLRQQRIWFANQGLCSKALVCNKPPQIKILGKHEKARKHTKELHHIHTHT